MGITAVGSDEPVAFAEPSTRRPIRPFVGGESPTEDGALTEAVER